MDRGYGPRTRGCPNAQQIDSGQPLSLTLQQHGLGGLFLSSAANPNNCSFVPVVPVGPVVPVQWYHQFLKYLWNTTSLTFLVDSVAMIAYI